MPAHLESALLVPQRNKVYQSLVTTYSIILLGRSRHLRINFFFNRLSNCRASGSMVMHLPTFLTVKFGDTAIGVKVGELVYRNDEEMMRDSLIKTGEAYHIVYEDYTPSYSEALMQPAPKQTSATPVLPKYNDVTNWYLRPVYFEELVYYPSIPTIQKSLVIKLKLGRKSTITLTNKDTQWQNALRHQLMLIAGYKAQGVIYSGESYYTDDEILWNAKIPDCAVVTVSFQPPQVKHTAKRPAIPISLRRVSTSRSSRSDECRQAIRAK